MYSALFIGPTDRVMYVGEVLGIEKQATYILPPYVVYIRSKKIRQNHTFIAGQ